MHLNPSRREAKRMPTDLSAQARYSAKVHRARKLGLSVPDAFVRGIRHLGYRSNVEAVAELVDNAIQAYAEHVDIIFGYDGTGSQKKPTQIAVLDDGHGMTPDMIQLAMMWGGTHRENDRSGLGRYGYGLPCATLSIGKRFTVISKVAGGPSRQVTLDLDDLNEGKYNDSDGDTVIPSPCEAQFPTFVSDYISRLYPDGWISGTIVLIEKLDRLDWTTSLVFAKHLNRRFGVTYHKLLSSTLIFVDGDPVLPCDPLFLDPSHTLYQIDLDQAVAFDAVTLDVPTSAGDAKIMLRYSYLPPSFASIDKSRDAIGLNANERFPILKDYHGVIFSRNGRLIDCKAKTPWTTFINNDRYIRIEVEFPASLDELFGVTTAKQQISVSPEIWDRLREAGFFKAIEQLRGRVRALKSERSRQRSSAPPKTEFHKGPSVIARPHRSSGQAAFEEGRDDPTPLLTSTSDGSLLPNMDHPAFASNGRPDSIGLQTALESLLAAIIGNGSDRVGHRRQFVAEILMNWGRSLGADPSLIAKTLGSDTHHI